MNTPSQTRTPLWQIITFALLFVVAAAHSALAETASYRLSLKDAEAMVIESLTDQGAGESLKIEVHGRPANILHQSAIPFRASLDAFDYDAGEMRWSATLNVYEGDKLVKTEALTGRYESMVEVPVLNKRMHRSDTNTESDIAWVGMPESRLRNDVALSAEELIGLSPRRVIAEGKPVRSNDLEKPQIISKGDLVQITFSTPTMQIRTVGQALSGGALGEMVQIRNNDSMIVVRGMITGAGQAEVNQLMQMTDNSRL